MPIPRRYTTDAIVLSRFDLGEADRVLTLITPDRRQAQGHRQGRPPPDLAARRQPRAVRRAQPRAGARPHVRRRHPGQRRPRLAPPARLARVGGHRLVSRRARRPLARGAPRRRAALRAPARAYELLDAGMAPGRVARWYEMHLLDELGQRPEVDRCVECDRVLEADERFRWVPPLGGVLCERCPGPPTTGRASASRRSSCSRPTSGSTSRRSRPCAWRRDVERETEAALREFVRGALERDARSLAFLDEVRTPRPVRPMPGERRTRSSGSRSVRRCDRGGDRGDARAPRPAGGRWSRGPRPAVPDHRRATVSRVGSGAGPPRTLVGRRPPRRFAAVGPRPPRPRRPRPGRRPAPARGERRAAGPRRHDQVAPPPQHRAQRRLERRRRPAGDRPRLAAGDMAAAPAAGPAPRAREPTVRGPLRRRLPGHPDPRRPGRLRGRSARRPVAHGRPPRDRGRPRARRRPGQRRGRRRRGLPDDVAEPFLRQRLRRVGPRPREGRPDRRPAARWSGGWRRAACSSTSPTRPPRPSTTSWRWRPGRSSRRTPASAASCDNARNLSDEHLRASPRPAASLGIGFWPTACGGDDCGVDRAVDPLRRRRRRRRPRRPRLRLRRRRPVPFDATGLVQLTDALLDAGLDDDAIGKVMGGNARRAAGGRAAAKPGGCRAPCSASIGHPTTAASPESP